MIIKTKLDIAVSDENVATAEQLAKKYNERYGYIGSEDISSEDIIQIALDDVRALTLADDINSVNELIASSLAGMKLILY